LYFGWGSTPDSDEGAHSTPPDLVAGFKGSTSKRRGGRENEGRGKGRGEEGERGRSVKTQLLYQFIVLSKFRT